MGVTLSAFSGVNIELYLLVFMRMSGAFILNPILGRANMPMQLRAALGFLLTLVVAPTLKDIPVHVNGVVQMMVMSMGELFVGLAVGVVVSTVLYIVLEAGELIDMQMGLTMAQMYDIHTGVNMPVLGNIFNVVMTLYFFASNAHLTLVTFFCDSFRLVAPGAVVPTQQTMHFIFSLGKDYFELGLRMALPIVAVEIICQISLGMLMKAVPSLNIFSIGIHMQTLVGYILLLVTATSIVMICSQLVTFMIDKVAQVIRLIGSA